MSETMITTQMSETMVCPKCGAIIMFIKMEIGTRMTKCVKCTNPQCFYIRELPGEFFERYTIDDLPF